MNIVHTHIQLWLCVFLMRIICQNAKPKQPSVYIIRTMVSDQTRPSIYSVLWHARSRIHILILYFFFVFHTFNSIAKVPTTAATLREKNCKTHSDNSNYIKFYYPKRIHRKKKKREKKTVCM